MFDNIHFKEFWNDCEYSKENYDSANLSDNQEDKNGYRKVY